MLGILAAIPSEAGVAHQGTYQACSKAKKGTTMNRTIRRVLLMLGAALVMAALAAAAAFAVDSTSFRMVRSQTAVANDCLEGATAHVDVLTTPTDNQIMDVTLNHAPKNTEFELFVTQQPNSPFGISWYQADFETNNQGHGEVRARGIFSEELFVFAPGVVEAPQVDDQDAEKNPKFKPVHTFHLGLWFADPMEATEAGCSGTVTPFDGDHEAGIQALSTRNFPDLRGPLGEKKPSKIQAPLGEIK